MFYKQGPTWLSEVDEITQAEVGYQGMGFLPEEHSRTPHLTHSRLLSHSLLILTRMILLLFPSPPAMWALEQLGAIRVSPLLCAPPQCSWSG